MEESLKSLMPAEEDSLTVVFRKSEQEVKNLEEACHGTVPGRYTTRHSAGHTQNDENLNQDSL